MASRKDKVKAAKAREQERLYYKEHPEELERILTEDDEKDSPKPAKRRLDSQGRKIPTESERRKIREREATRKSREESVDADAKQQSAKEKDESALPKPSSSKGNSKRSYKTYGKGSKVPVGADKASAKERGFILTLFLYMKQNPKPVMIASGAIIAIVLVAAVIASALQSTQPELATDDEKARSLIGITMPAKKVVADTGKFDGFLVDGKSGIPYTDLFDCTVTAEDAPVLASRGQSALGDGTFEYNESVSSAKPSKDAAAAEQESTSNANTEGITAGEESAVEE